MGAAPAGARVSAVPNLGTEIPPSLERAARSGSSALLEPSPIHQRLIGEHDLAGALVALEHLLQSREHRLVLRVPRFGSVGRRQQPSLESRELEDLLIRERRELAAAAEELADPGLI